MMVKCPNCGIEYSLGRKIYHSCKGFSIYHGSVCHEPRKEYPWNCDCVVKSIRPKLDKSKSINLKIKPYYIETFEGD